MTTTRPTRLRDGERAIGSHDPVMAPVDIVLAEARRLRAAEMDRLLSAGLSRCKRTLVSMVAPMFGWNRRAIVPSLRYDRQASLASYVKALRAETETGNHDRWLGHGT